MIPETVLLFLVSSYADGNGLFAFIMKQVKNQWIDSLTAIFRENFVCKYIIMSWD